MSIRFACWASVTLTLMGSACGLGPDVYLMETAYLIDAEGNEMYLGAGCESVSARGGSGTGLGGMGYEITHVQKGDGVHIAVRGPTNAVLAERHYTEEFLATGEEETLTVELGDGRSIRLRHWGGPECDPPVSDDAE